MIQDDSNSKIEAQNGTTKANSGDSASTPAKGSPEIVANGRQPRGNGAVYKGEPKRMGASGEEIHTIIDGCIRGERKDQQRVFEMFYSKMLGICARYTRDVDDAKDVLQDGFIKVFNNIGKFNKSGSLESWVRRIIVNTAIDYYRKNRNAALLLDENYQFGEEDENMVDTDDNSYSGLSPEAVVKAVQQLSPAYRIVFNMYVVEDYSHKEIAEELNISIGTSKSNLAKAKKNLKKILQTQELYSEHG